MFSTTSVRAKRATWSSCVLRSNPAGSVYPEPVASFALEKARRSQVSTGPVTQPEDCASLSTVVELLKYAGHALKDRYFWHTSDDPYVLFLAEFFLRRSNRTTVARFLPSFVELFPNTNVLANADPDEVVAATNWAGLSSRTKCLPTIASRLIEQASWSASELRELPHIGPYAADGIALYVYSEPRFPIDNNVRRVLGRSLGLENDESLVGVTTQILRSEVRHDGVAGVRLTHMGALAIGWNYCRVTPRCDDCPLSDVCQNRGQLTTK